MVKHKKAPAGTHLNQPGNRDFLHLKRTNSINQITIDVPLRTSAPHLFKCLPIPFQKLYHAQMMCYNYLYKNMSTIQIIQGIISLFAVLFAITIHEASHGWSALKMGDPTAYSLGRVTLNPIPHIDPLGTIILPLILVITGAPPFGWAKPVPVNPYNFKNPKRDNLIVSAAGPAANLIAAFGAFIVLQIIRMTNPEVVGTMIYYLKRSYLLTLQGPKALLMGLVLLIFYFIIINVILAVFNLIPIPPLDGSGILMGFLSPEAAQKYEMIQPYGFFIVILLVMTGIVGRILQFILSIVYLIL